MMGVLSPIALYIHWPFCLAKCPYCDFNSHVCDTVDHTQWKNALVQELSYYAGLLGPRSVTSLFFGGGTPSLMRAATVAAVIDAAAEHFDIVPECEITLEANPTSVEAEKFIEFRHAGVNRVSLGIQSLRDEDLKILGRRHTAKEALKALEIAHTYFDRVSFDLIYARTGQTMGQWAEELNEALELGVNHMSLYQLTIEPGTQFFTLYQRGDLSIPDEDLGGEFYETTQAMMSAAGLPAYEISNHARPGHESRHNLTYWRYGDYVGVGPGAHGRLTLEGQKWATRAHRAPDIWLRRVGAVGHGAHPFEKLPMIEQIIERLMMGLRLAAPVDLSSYGSIYTLFDRRVLQELQDAGYIGITPHSIHSTLSGRQRLNGILKELVAALRDPAIQTLAS